MNNLTLPYILIHLFFVSESRFLTLSSIIQKDENTNTKKDKIRNTKYKYKKKDEIQLTKKSIYKGLKN